MRIAQVVHNYPPEFRGGVERAVEQLAAELRAQGHHLTVIAGSERVAAEAGILEEEHEGVAVLRLVRPGAMRTPTDPGEPHLDGIYEEALARVGPDVVHVHHWWNLGDDLVRRAQALGMPAGLTLHDHFATCSLFFRLPDWRTPCSAVQEPDTCARCLREHGMADALGLDEREVAFGVGLRRHQLAREVAAASFLLAPSAAHGRACAAGLELDADAIRVVPLGTPAIRPVEPERSLPRFPAAPLRLLHFGNLSILKGVDLLLDAVQLADPGGERIEVRLAGKRTDFDTHPRATRDEGPYEREQLRGWAAWADLAVFPSRALESYGLVVDEALALGLPVLASARGALAERLGGRGEAIGVDGPEPLAAVLRRVLEDPSVLEAWQRAPRPRLSDPAEVARQHVVIYEEARSRPLPPGELEFGPKARARHYRERFGEVIALLRQAGGERSHDGA